MTKEELSKIPFRWMSHTAWADEHTTVYYNEEHDIGYCDHTPMRNGQPYGRCFRHYSYKGKVYKSVNKLLEAINK